MCYNQECIPIDLLMNTLLCRLAVFQIDQRPSDRASDILIDVIVTTHRVLLSTYKSHNLENNAV